MGTEANILSGPALLSICAVPSATNEPFGTAGTFKNPVVATANVYVDVGYLEDGVTVSYEPTLVDIGSDHETLAVKRLLTGEKVTFKGVMQEATFRNMQLAMAGDAGSALGGDATAEDAVGPSTSPGFNKLQIGKKSVFDIGPPVLGNKLRTLAVAFRGTNPEYLGDTLANKGARVWYLYRCTANANVEQKYFKGGIVMIPVEFSVLLFDSTDFSSVEQYDVVTDFAFAPDAPSPLV